jgi:hypothetical protein
MSAMSHGRVGGIGDVDRGLARFAAEFSRIGLLDDCLATVLLDSAGSVRRGTEDLVGVDGDYPTGDAR